MTTPASAARPPLWRDVRILRVVAQGAVVLVVGAFALWLWNNVQTNAASTGIPLTLDYLDQPSDMTVPGNDLRATQSVQDAIIVGLGNTIRVSLAGVVLATMVGIIVGIARLSTNWLLSRLAQAYVETLRNIPLLAIIVFAYIALALRLPRLEDATTIGNFFIASIRGVAVPWYRIDGSRLAVGIVFVAALAVAWLVARWRRRTNETTGAPAYRWTAALVGFAVTLIVGQVALGSPVSISGPSVGGRQIIGGITMLPEYAALLASLVAYTSSHIAEIVRGSIQAVPKGQVEAASALALSPSQRMRLVILPQAMRIAVPAIGNQYLNLTKNSSLGVAISYFELTKITSVSIGNRAPAVPSYAVLLAIYLVLSLVLSAIVNVANRRLELVER
ncbi:MAG: amino acid ABC transporter permease [Acidimicrobiales bacterium]